MGLEIGDVIDGKYRILRLLGKGGMGTVYESENLRIRRRVAIKVLHAAVAEDDTMVRRFEHEAQAAGRIGSAHIVEVLDLGELPDGDRYMVMEFLEGVSLKERMASGMAPADLMQLVLQLLDGLADAHDAGIIHRDLKPANVFLIRRGKREGDFVKILDFGVSKFRQHSKEMAMTHTGSIIGTPHYMSPEQARGGAVDQRADLFAVGIIMYRALCGQVPFEASSVNELMFKVVLEDVPRLEQRVAGLDPELCRIVHLALARTPDERYPDARQFGADVERWLEANGVSPLSTGSISHSGMTPPPVSNPTPSWGAGTPSSVSQGPIPNLTPAPHILSGAGPGPVAPGAVAMAATTTMPAPRQRTQVVGGNETAPPQVDTPWPQTTGGATLSQARSGRSFSAAAIGVGLAGILAGIGAVVMLTNSDQPAAVPAATAQPAATSEPSESDMTPSANPEAAGGGAPSQADADATATASSPPTVASPPPPRRPRPTSAKPKTQPTATQPKPQATAKSKGGRTFRTDLD